jgi:uncharacterized protein (TIGR03437 family)
MTHASLCKKTYETSWRLQGPKLRQACSRFIAALLFLAFAGVLFAQSSISPTVVPNATLGVAYSVQLQDSNVPASFPVTWGIVEGSLPPGLMLNTGSTTATTTISGTPTATGNYSFEVEAEYNTSAPTVSNQSYSILVTACTPTVSPASPLPQADVTLPYGPVRFQTSGCPGSYTFTFAEQPINQFSPNNPPEPPGLSMTAAGVFSGTPTTAGTFSFFVNVTDQNNDVTQIQYKIIINPLPTVTTASPLPNGSLGVPYSEQISATGGDPPYTFSMDGNVPGINMTSSGIFGGTPTQGGTFQLRIGVTDILGGETSSPFQVTFGVPVAQIQVAPLGLTFNADLSGNNPPTQAIAVVPATGATPPVNFHVVIDNGQSGTPAPPWINVTPLSGTAPVGLVVSVNQGTMPAGNYPARIQVLDSNGLATDVTVTLNVASVPQQLTVAPAILNLAARSATPGNLTEELVISNSGAGTLAFTASVVGGSSWISSVTASSSSTTPNAPVFVQVQVNTSGLQVGSYHDAIQISSSAANVQIPVSLFIASSGPILGVDTTGVLFQAIEGGGSTVTQIVKVLNLGGPSSTVNWNASLLSGSNWLSLVSSSGTATSSAEGNLTLALAPNATELAPGPYYAIIKITDPNSLNSPQYVIAVLNLQPNTAAPAPALVPGGLFFTSEAGATAAPTPQQVQVNTSSSSAVTFNASVSTLDGGTWLSAAPASGNASGQAAGSIAVSVDPTGLPAGIYAGTVSVSIGALLQSVNVIYVVQPVTSTNASLPSSGHLRPRAAACSASKLALTETGLPNNFTVPAGWPATLIVQLNDDCASPVTNGSVIASFSNGDAPLNLVGDSLGNYSTTWQPGAVNGNMVITLNATAGTLRPATVLLYGGVAANQTPPPTLAPGGTLNNLNPVVGAPLSPGTIAQVYGSGLGSAPVSIGHVPLLTMFNNTFALVGPTQAPLYFLSSGQVNIEIPADATATQQTPIVLSVNNALTLPLMLNIVPATPGVLSSDDGPTRPSLQNGAHIIAQHSADFSLVTSSNPAKPGEYLVMYLVGMGATNPAVASGAASPTSPLAKVTAQPTVMLDSQSCTVTFAGLTPNFVGLYQIDFQVPSNAKSGELEVDVTQNGIAANPTLLPVSN